MPDKLMIDIESMSTHPGNALVLSIGAVRFAIGAGDAPMIGEKRLWILPIADQLLDGREVSPDTQRWWAQQSHEARSHWMTGTPQPITNTLLGLSELAQGAETVWANGIVFDIANIESLYRSKGIAVPWKYNAPRDARTIYALPKARTRQSVEVIVEHEPVHDCVEQIWRLWEHWPETAMAVPS